MYERFYLVRKIVRAKELGIGKDLPHHPSARMESMGDVYMGNSNCREPKRVTKEKYRRF